MDREEAKEYIKSVREFYATMEKFAQTKDEAKFGEALDMAIEALSAEPTNLISRADAIALLTKIVFDEPPYLDSETLCRLYAEEQINALPSADRPSGEWVKHNDISTIIVYYTCSECGEIESGTPPYCRKCGAKMGGDTR